MGSGGMVVIRLSFRVQETLKFTESPARAARQPGLALPSLWVSLEGAFMKVGALGLPADSRVLRLRVELSRKRARRPADTSRAQTTARKCPHTVATSVDPLLSKVSAGSGPGRVCG